MYDKDDKSERTLTSVAENSALAAILSGNARKMRNSPKGETIPKGNRKDLMIEWRGVTSNSIEIAVVM